MSEDEFNQLEDKVQTEISDALVRLTRDKTAVNNIQPTSAVIKAAAKAATFVLMAFERGYRIGEK